MNWEPELLLTASTGCEARATQPGHGFIETDVATMQLLAGLIGAGIRNAAGVGHHLEIDATYIESAVPPVELEVLPSGS
jgi:hypothetical protein